MLLASAGTAPATAVAAPTRRLTPGPPDRNEAPGRTGPGGASFSLAGAGPGRRRGQGQHSEGGDPQGKAEADPPLASDPLPFVHSHVSSRRPGP